MEVVRIEDSPKRRKGQVESQSTWNVWNKFDSSCELWVFFGSGHKTKNTNVFEKNKNVYCLKKHMGRISEQLEEQNSSSDACHAKAGSNQRI